MKCFYCGNNYKRGEGCSGVCSVCHNKLINKEYRVVITPCCHKDRGIWDVLKHDKELTYCPYCGKPVSFYIRLKSCNWRYRK